MNNNIRIILCSVILAVVVSLLYLVVPITATFVVSHIFSLIAIGSIALSLYVYGDGNNMLYEVWVKAYDNHSDNNHVLSLSYLLLRLLRI